MPRTKTSAQIRGTGFGQPAGRMGFYTMDPWGVRLIGLQLGPKLRRLRAILTYWKPFA
ncbi:hypothetical protein [Pseudosulfitobacter koreensis]|uniref:Uncharacterized protein n=1 Tax=Pseudosulfitobacter koreensis TaxID=2968472 RepID=A0ABT1YZE6_9RHOB|nr:hypothetical protein [Pseudosulfitobacter koreense]MCR8826221.1 hypothetical protein [Pseudosulfitobacter koreense]